MSASASASASAAAAVIVSLHWLLLFAAAVEDDVLCLEGVKSSLSDPRGSLSSWTFTNTSATHMCNDLEGVTCWNLNENRIISLQLTGLELSGGLPESLKNCHSLQTLDLSQNKLDGPIPTQICQWLPYLVKLDLSSNSLSGSIPSQITNRKFLNNLILSDNKLYGSIPRRPRARLASLDPVRPSSGACRLRARPRSGLAGTGRTSSSPACVMADGRAEEGGRSSGRGRKKKKEEEREKKKNKNFEF